MRHYPGIKVLSALALMVAVPAPAQRADQLTNATRAFVSVPETVVALVDVTVIDGTGAAPRRNQTVVIRDGRIAAVGPSASTRAPDGARVMNLAGHTVIPGLVGVHNHMFYTAAGGRRVQATFTSSRLYLASGVTTIRTTGSNAPYADINTKADIDAGRAPGPRVHITAPYITGARGAGYMTAISSPEQARRFVNYWGDEGATWLKAYTNIRSEDLKAAIDEAHKRGMKVTGHLCSVSFQEAVALGIDNLEHGLFTASDFVANKTVDVCPSGLGNAVVAASPSSEPWSKTIQTMIGQRVSMTSTLAVYEPGFPNRPPRDQRVLDAMAPEVREAYLGYRRTVDENPNPRPLTALKNAMSFEVAFFRAGGLLGAGVDPTGQGGALPGYGDQRNYELLIESGFTPSEVVQIMSLHGAKILGVDGQVGSVQAGKIADLVVLQGDLPADPMVIRKTVTVFKDGVGYDPRPLIESVRGRVGIS
jgi:imidazolonepropionase-like amidohydrolase